MAFVPNSQLFPMSFAQFEQILSEKTVVTGTPDALMIERVGFRLAEAADKWLTAQGFPNHLDDYEWEFRLIQDNSINAWAMPGGKIAFYTGILPVTQNEAGVAVVMGHEIAHSLLNHGQQRMSAGILQQVGAVGLAVGLGVAGISPEAQNAWLLAYGVGTAVGGTLPFSRRHEREADHLGLILMAIAGFNPDEAIPFWERMSALGSGGSPPQFLSTHPSSASRVRNMRNISVEAKQIAAEFGVHFP